MLSWMAGRRRLWKVARGLRDQIRAARAGTRPWRSTPPFAELLAEALRLRDAGLGYEVRLTAEQRGAHAWGHTPERVSLAPSAPGKYHTTPTRGLSAGLGRIRSAHVKR